MRTLVQVRLLTAYVMAMLCTLGCFHVGVFRALAVLHPPYTQIFFTLFALAWFAQGVVIHRKLGNDRG